MHPAVSPHSGSTRSMHNTLALPASHAWCGVGAPRPALHVVTRNPCNHTQRASVSCQWANVKANQSLGYAVTGPGNKLEEWTRTVDAPLGSEEVDIEVTHNGVCHTDVHMQSDDWGISKFPFIPGHEVVGRVKAVGSSIKLLKPGDRVGVGWIKDSCRRCLNCLRGQENVCVKGYTGLIVGGGHGGFQQVLRAPVDFTYKIPDGLDSASAAPLLCAGVTVYAPLKAHIPHPGAHVAILGIGGLGHLAVQFAAKMGAQVTAIGTTADKVKEANELGASKYMTWDEAVQMSKQAAEHPEQDPQPGSQFDLILNCASSKIDTAALLTMLKNDGTLIQAGIPGGGATMIVPLQNLVFGQKKVAGSIVGGRHDMREMLEFAAAKGVRPYVEKMPLEKVNEAMERVKSGKARYRVVLISPGAEDM